MITLLAQVFFSWGTVLGVGIIAFGLGLLLRSAIIFKQRKRILSLEEEMLSNHERILTLEKKMTDSRKDKNGVVHEYDLSSSRISDREVKIS
ncbi:MAG: hypothetical protein ABI405_10760 [Parafilimonas sp.]